MLKNWKQTYIEATNLLPKNLKEAMQNGFSDNCQVFEIRLILDNFPLVITSNGVKTINFNISGQILEQSVISLTGNSYHSYQRELAKGFIPLKNGHRAGIAGTVVYGEKNEILSIKNITAIVLRIANEVALEKNILIDDFIKNGLHSIFISGPPCSGKTTFLRDTAKKLSELDYSVVVIDERQELFIGLSKCIVIKSVSKPQGIEMAVKSLSPQILICDEISNSEESEACQLLLHFIPAERKNFKIKG